MSTLRLLIMEDEFIIALDLSNLAQDLGYAVLGPFATLVDGTRAIESIRPDAAILDVQLADGEVYPLADALMQMGVPLIFHSGHADQCGLLARYPGARSAGKPCPSSLLAEQLGEVIALQNRDLQNCDQAGSAIPPSAF
jgi:hypothetical protein